MTLDLERLPSDDCERTDSLSINRSRSGSIVSTCDRTLPRRQSSNITSALDLSVCVDYVIPRRRTRIPSDMLLYNTQRLLSNEYRYINEVGKKAIGYKGAKRKFHRSFSIMRIRPSSPLSD